MRSAQRGLNNTAGDISDVVNRHLSLGSSHPAAGPPQLFFQHIKIVSVGKGDHVERMGALADDDNVLVGDIQAFLSIECQHDIGSPFFQFEFDLDGVRNDQRTIGQGKWADGTNDDAGDFRMNHRTAGGQGIGGGSRGRCDDEPICFKRGQIRFVDIGCDAGQPGQSAPVYDNIIEYGLTDNFFILPPHLDVETHAAFDGIIIIEDIFGRRNQVSGRRFRQKSDFTELDTQDRNIEVPYPADGA